MEDEDQTCHICLQPHFKETVRGQERIGRVRLERRGREVWRGRLGRRGVGEEGGRWLGGANFYHYLCVCVHASVVSAGTQLFQVFFFHLFTYFLCLSFKFVDHNYWCNFFHLLLQQFVWISFDFFFFVSVLYLQTTLCCCCSSFYALWIFFFFALPGHKKKRIYHYHLLHHHEEKVCKKKNGPVCNFPIGRCRGMAGSTFFPAWPPLTFSTSMCLLKNRYEGSTSADPRSFTSSYLLLWFNESPPTTSLLPIHPISSLSHSVRIASSM